MNRHEQLLNLAWILLGGVACAYSSSLGIMAGSKPGSGLVPFLAGAILGLAGLVRCVAGFRAGGGYGAASSFWPSATCRNRTLLVLAGFCVMAFLMPKLGFLLSAVLVTSFLLYVIEHRHPLNIMCTAVVTCLLVYGLFVALLRVNLPRGILGF